MNTTTLENIDYSVYSHNLIDAKDINELTKISLLKRRISLLNTICNELNPYNPVPEKIKSILVKFQIITFDDPFMLTNKLILLLEDSLEELHRIEKNNSN